MRFQCKPLCRSLGLIFPGEHGFLHQVIHALKDMMFKRCNKCGVQWESRNDFLADPNIAVVGYQVFFENLKMGLFLFNHSCNTTVSVEADLLLDLYKGTFHTHRHPTGDRKCPGRCLNENILSPCSDECKCAFISKLLTILKHWKKN